MLALGLGWWWEGGGLRRCEQGGGGGVKRCVVKLTNTALYCAQLSYFFSGALNMISTEKKIRI